MDLKCPECATAYRIDDSKIPSTGHVVVRCAECGHKIRVSAPSSGVGSTDAPSAESQRPIEYFDPDTKTALIYCPDIQAKMEMESKLNSLEFQVRSISDRAELAHLLRFNIFDLVLLYQGRPEPEDKLLEILDHFNRIPPESRRKMFLAYIHIAGNRHDKLDAFYRGVDVCLNPMDIGRLDELVPQLLKEKDGEYRVFYEVKKRVLEAVV
jgi:predicted Zn finger-like uncharacterized protein